MLESIFVYFYFFNLHCPGLKHFPQQVGGVVRRLFNEMAVARQVASASLRHIEGVKV
jgi:hypothetical protein